jgi:ribosomal protein S18 acetylase RimI-like enzyme
LNRELIVARVETVDAFESLLGLLLAYERSLPPDLRHGSEPDLAEVQRAYRDPNAAFLARLDGDAVGCVAVTHWDAATAVMKRLYVDPERRRIGAARGLVTAALDYCRERNYGRIVLDTDSERLPAAYELYRSLGFKLCEPYGPVEYRHPTFMEMVLS